MCETCEKFVKKYDELDRIVKELIFMKIIQKSRGDYDEPHTHMVQTVQKLKRVTEKERHERRKNIIDYVEEHPYSSQENIAKAVGIPKGSISDYCRILCKIGRLVDTANKAEMVSGGTTRRRPKYVTTEYWTKAKTVL